MDAIRWVQDLPFSTWIRESSWALFTWLILHVYAMASLAGSAAFIAARSFGVAPNVKPETLRKFIPVMWFGFFLALASGLLLLMAYPAKALTNPVYYVKFVFLLAAVLLTRQLIRQANAGGTMSKPIAAASLICWVGVISCGKLIEYTHSVLLVY